VICGGGGGIWVKSYKKTFIIILLKYKPYIGKKIWEIFNAQSHSSQKRRK